MTFDSTEEDAILERIRERVSAEAPRARRRRRAKRVGVVVASAIAVAAVSGSYLLMAASQKDIERSAICYVESSLGSQSMEVSSVDTSVDIKTGKKVAEPAADPISLCASAWRTGVIHHEAGTPPREVPGPVPDLVACVLPNGEPAVFPKDDIEDLCNVLGIASFVHRNDS